MIRRHGFEAVMQRQLYSLALGSPGEAPTLAMPFKHFACLIAWDARRVSPDTIYRFAEWLLNAGATYFVCWGPDCGRVHDIIDKVSAADAFAACLENAPCIMTTWHEDETLEDAIEFLLLNSSPDEAYLGKTRAALAISVGSEEWDTQIGIALDDPRRFVASLGA